MAIRGFRSKMKPIVWVITIFFLISLVAGYVATFRTGSNSSQIAFKLNGEKYSIHLVQRAMALSEMNYKNRAGMNSLDQNIIGTITFNNLSI